MTSGGHKVDIGGGPHIKITYETSLSSTPMIARTKMFMRSTVFDSTSKKLAV